MTPGAAPRDWAGRHRLAGPQASLPRGERLFTFVGFDALAGPPGPRRNTEDCLPAGASAGRAGAVSCYM
jgi:hypothetical protein